MKLESAFQKSFKEQLKEIFPGCIIKRNSTDDIQGFPDITVFYHNKYAMLEFKRHKDAIRQPNQEFYIDLFKRMGAYASFVYPEIADTIKIELKLYFGR